MLEDSFFFFLFTFGHTRLKDVALVAPTASIAFLQSFLNNLLNIIQDDSYYTHF